MMQKGAFYETAERLCDKTSACQRPGSSGHGALAVRHGRPGLFLERQANFSTQSFRFRRGTPRNGRRYRLCPAKYGDTAPSEELLELYADQGWQYVVCAGRGTICVHVFFHDDPAAPEPFTDTDSLIYALRTPIRRGFATLLFSGYLLFHAITRLSWGLDRGPIYRLEAIGFYVPICICFFLLLMDRGVNLAALLLFRRRLRQEKQPPLPYSATLFRAQTVLEAFIVPLFLFILFSFGFSTLSSRSDLPLTNWDPDFPLLTLAEVDGGDGWTPDENQTPDENRTALPPRSIRSPVMMWILTAPSSEPGISSTRAVPGYGAAPPWRSIILSTRLPAPPKACWRSWNRPP